MSKVEKPYPEFPLTPHRYTNRWCKKIRGKVHYFGPLADPQAALERWEHERDYLLTGRIPPANSEGVRVKDLLNGFLEFKRQRVTSGELSQGMWNEYKRMTDAIVETFGKGRLVSDLDASDFGRLREYLTRGRGLVALGNAICKCRVVFRWGFDSDLLERPVRTGKSFDLPSRSALRKKRTSRGRTDYTAVEIRMMLKKAKALRAFILLGINCGFGSGDIGKMPLTALDLKSGWVTYPRPKTGVARRCKLWPETVDALKRVLGSQPERKDHEGLAFLTKKGNPWNRWHGENNIDAIAQAFTPLCREAGVEDGRGFYGLRRTLATIGDEARDPVALRHIMGHAAPATDMGDVYRQVIEDDRLEAVAEHVRKWLWPAKKANGKSKKAVAEKAGAH